MPLRVLELARFHVISNAQPLKLEVISGADVTGPQSLADLDDDAWIKAVTSRQLWVTRGRGCRIDIEILLDGKALDRRTYSDLLHSLGCFIRDSEAWSQLLLSTSLEIPPIVPSVRSRHLSIHLNNSTKPSANEDGVAEWLGSIDVDPPPGVVGAQLDRLQVHFNFVSLLKAAVDDLPALSDLCQELPKAMLLDLQINKSPVFSQQSDSHSLEQVVELLKGLPSQILNSFESPASGDNKLPLDHSAISNPKTQERNGSLSVPQACEGDRGGGTRSRRIPQKARAVIEAWINTHQHNLYPTLKEKERLLHATGLQKRQLNTQLFRYRQKMKRGAIGDVHGYEEGEMLQDGQIMNDVSADGWNRDSRSMIDSVRHTAMVENDKETIFSQASSVSFPLSQSSTVSTTRSVDTEITSASSNRAYWNKGSSSSSFPTITVSTTFSLINAAFGCLMGASSPQRGSNSEGLQVRNLPDVTISSFAPSMFSPGFKNSVAGHSRFLPIISHALSLTIPRNVQTPSLRRKLIKLSNLEPSRLSDYDTQNGRPGTVERLSSIVQSRLWVMMQRKLFDKAAGRRLWRHSTQQGGEDESDFEDMLATDDDGINMTGGENDGMSDDEMLFADDKDEHLLLDDDDDDPDDYPYIDWERHDVEHGTDDMVSNDNREQHGISSTDEMLLGDSMVGLELSGNDHNIVLQGESDNEILLDDSIWDMLNKVEAEISKALVEDSEVEEMLI